MIKKYTYHPKSIAILTGHVQEDATSVSKKYPIMAVADGVTILKRHPDGSYPVLPDGQSGPKKVADLFCDKAVRWLEKQYPKISSKTILEAFRQGNEAVRKLNEELLGIKINDLDYGVKSFAAVASVGCILNGKLIYGFLTDCGIAVVGKDARLKLITPEIWPRIKQSKDKSLQSILKKGEGSHRHYYRYLRNNPRLVVGGKFYSYGVINGQPGAIKYVEIGQQKISQKDTVVIFTDGFRHYFNHQEFLKILANPDLKGFEKKLDLIGKYLLNWKNSVPGYGLERTLVLLRR